MRRKKSKFSTFIFSLLPGAGHMYIGFMNMGLSLMSAFFFVIFLSSWLDIGPLMLILPMIWFYSFLDCMNKVCSSDEEFLLLEDNYLFSIDKLAKFDKDILQKRKLLTGILLLFLGGYLVLKNIMRSLERFIPHEIYMIIDDITRLAPQIILGIAIIALGAKLIMGKKRESDPNA